MEEPKKGTCCRDGVCTTVGQVDARREGIALAVVTLSVDKVNKGRPRNRGKVYTQEYPLGRGKLSKSEKLLF